MVERVDIVLGNRIVHFEIPVQDAEKMGKFYGELFNWKIEKQSMPGMDYWMIYTAGNNAGDLNGGMYVRENENDRPRFFVSVDNIDEHIERLKRAGGAAVTEKMEVPQMGYTFLGTDPEGNLVGLFQSTTPSRPPSKPAHRRRKVGASKRRSSSRKRKKTRRG